MSALERARHRWPVVNGRVTAQRLSPTAERAVEARARYSPTPVHPLRVVYVQAPMEPPARRRRPALVAGLVAGALAVAGALVWAVAYVVVTLVAWIAAHAGIIIGAGALLVLLMGTVGRSTIVSVLVKVRVR